MHNIFLFKSSGSIKTFLFESIKCCLDNNGDCKMSIGTRMSELIEGLFHKDCMIFGTLS